MVVSDYYSERDGVLALCDSCAVDMEAVVLIGAALNTMECDACGRSEGEEERIVEVGS